MRVIHTSTRSRVLFVAALLFAAVAAVITVRLIMQEPTAHYPQERLVYWHLAVENTTNEPLRDVQIRSFAPLRLSWQQRLESLEANVPLLESDGGRRAGDVRANVQLIPPFGRREIRFRARVAMADDHGNARLRDADVSSSDRTRGAAPSVEIATLARQLERRTTMETTRSIYEWLVSEIEYTGYDPIDRGAAAAFEKRAGDCSEYAALAVALAQALALPARKVNGFVVHEDGRLGPFDFHAWAEVRVGDRWVILDGQEKRFDPIPSAYLATGYGLEGRGSEGIKFAANSDAVQVHML